MKWFAGRFSDQQWAGPIHLQSLGISICKDDLAGWSVCVNLVFWQFGFIQRQGKGIREWV